MTMIMVMMEIYRKSGNIDDNYDDDDNGGGHDG